jgi:hypothetical protein
MRWTCDVQLVVGRFALGGWDVRPHPVPLDTGDVGRVAWGAEGALDESSHIVQNTQ